MKLSFGLRFYGCLSNFLSHVGARSSYPLRKIPRKLKDAGLGVSMTRNNQGLKLEEKVSSSEVKEVSSRRCLLSPLDMFPGECGTNGKDKEI